MVGGSRPKTASDGRAERSCCGRMEDRLVIGTQRPASLYHGWLVVAAAFLVAMYGFGLGFYGPGIYLVALEAGHGWSTVELSPAITVYYVLGAAWLLFCVGPLFDRRGARTVVALGTAAMACGVVLLASTTRLWQVYAAFAAMSVGWATMSGAAITIIVAPWFDRRRGLAVSWSLNGGSAGGVVIAPLLTVLIARFGLANRGRSRRSNDTRDAHSGGGGGAPPETRRRARLGGQHRGSRQPAAGRHPAGCRAAAVSPHRDAA